MKQLSKINNLLVFIVISILILFNSCEKEKIFPYEPKDTIEELHMILEDYYFWIDSIPRVDFENYSSPQELLEAMRFLPKDKWSYITTKEENEQYYVEGKYIGYGFGFTPDNEGNMRITYLYDDCDFKTDGIDRSWKINTINGTTVNENTNIPSLLGTDAVGISNTFEFESTSGTTVSKSYLKKEVDIKTVVYSEIIVDGTNKIGYLVFESFIEPSKEELTETFLEFKNAGVTDLVIDLRYNGGGLLSIVEHMANLIIPDAVNGEKFLSYVHNNYTSNLNESIYFEQNSNSLKLSSVYFIAGKGSASASEAIINGLEPHLDNVYIVGNDTYGKPVGMYSFNSRYSNLVYVPICFSLENAAGYGSYFDGLKADSYVDDDTYHTFGKDEAIFSEVFNHIKNGSFSSSKSSSELRKTPKKEIRSIKDERGSL
ncbi:MAG: hypothetical protein JEY96_16275 [Bacteroidales bacterium]|nr:hypothetical protein [Bacteroidales bacterium]